MDLYFFDHYGRAEQIRMLLNHAKIEYNDMRVTKDKFEQMKADGKLEFCKLPCLTKDGKIYVESLAIMRYLGSIYGYYPEDII